MPRSGDPLQINAGPSTSKHQDTYYTDNDIKLLHKIVIQAQDLLSPSVLPTSALFIAYFDILEQYQIRPEHDLLYARVLFKISSLHGPETLLDKFQFVLHHMGIEVEFFSPRQKEDNDILQIQPLPEDSFTKATDNNHLLYFATPKRRNSENSMWDIVAKDNSQSQKWRINSFSSIPHIKPGVEAEEDSTETRLDFQRSKNESPSTRSQYYRYTQRVGSWLASEPPNSRNRSLSSYDGSQIDKEFKKLLYSQQNKISLPASTDFHFASLTTPLSSLLDEETTVRSSSTSPKELLDSDTSLDIKANLIFNRRLALRIKSRIQAWRNLAKEIHNYNLYLNDVATNQYFKNILRAIFENWSMEARQKRTSRQISTYYNDLNERATRGRRGFLLYLAFSHWSNFTTERIQLTAKTRKRIIQTRIFNAWRNITAVDELKIKNHIIERKFRIWKLQYISTKAREDAAIIRYNISIIQNYYSVWRVAVLTNRMNTCWAYRSLHLTLIKWNFKYQIIFKQLCEAEIFRENHICLNSLNLWILQTRKLVNNNQKAELFYNSKVEKRILLGWSKQIALMPPLMEFQNQFLCRQVRDIFFSWLHQTREERRAISSDRIKILREAWTNWRHQTRTVLFRLRSDNYIIEQTIYIWIIKARSNLANRLRNANLLRGIIYKWNLTYQALRKHHQSQEELAHEIFARKAKNFVLLQWYSRMESLQKDKAMAENLDKPRTLKFMIQIWVSDLQHLQKLNRWAQDAGYYLLASRIMKRWKTSTESAKRNKRKNAFIIVRRKLKINLLRRTLQIWIKEAQGILNRQSWAAEIHQNRICVSGREIFYRWLSYAEELLELKIMWQEKVLRKYIAIWIYKMKHVLALEPEAIIIYQERQKSKILQKWSHHSLHIRAHENPAYEIREKNFKKNKRRMFIYWRDRVNFQKATSIQTLPDLDLEEIAKNEAWSEFGEEANNKDDLEERIFNRDVMPSSIPAYLNTPSKRSERIKAALAKNSKTPITPLSTTQNREFRVTRTGGLFSSITKKRLNNFNSSINDTL